MTQRQAAAAAASTNVSETVVAPYDIAAPENAVAAEALQRESRTLVLRGIEQLLRTEQY